MAPSSPIELDDGQKIRLLRIARESILTGLANGQAGAPAAGAGDGILAETLASFVTLTRGGALRGCVGHLRATRPLAEDVADAAYAAAFQDHRFSPLSAAELETTEIEISVLSTPEPLAVHSQQELLEQLQPGRDGLVLEDGSHSATFLPQVWEQLPDPREFLAHLKHKAGWPAEYWSAKMRCYRYATCSFSESEFAQLKEA